MRVRSMQNGDVAAVANISWLAFKDDELYTWLHPRQDQYPDHLRKLMVIRVRGRMVENGLQCIVAESEENDDGWTGAPEVTGFAFWLREGNDEAARQWQQDTLWRKLDRRLIAVERYYHDHVVDRSADDERVEIFRQAIGFDHNPQPGHWHLEVLATSPDWQRRGVGETLVRWGMENGTKENVPCTLESSPAARRLYTKLGFVIGDTNKFREGLEGVWMMWEPDHLKGRWFPEIEEKVKNRHKIKEEEPSKAASD